MELKKIWMSPDTGRGSRFARRTVGGVLGIALLMLLLIGGGVWLSFRFGLPRELFAVVLCFGVTALAAALAVLLGRRSMQDATVFFLTADDRLYALDARGAVRFGHGVVASPPGRLRCRSSCAASPTGAVCPRPPTSCSRSSGSGKTAATM